MDLSERIALLEASDDPAIAHRLEKIRVQIERAERKLSRSPQAWAASGTPTRRLRTLMTLDDEED